MRRLGTKHLPLIAVLYCFLSPPISAQTEGEMLAILRFPNQSGDSRFDNFHLQLRKRFEYEALVPGLPVKAWDATADEIGSVDSVDTARFRFVVFGSFTYDSSRHDAYLEFSVLSRFDKARSAKRILLQGMSPDEAADVVVLKAIDFLRRGLLGTLKVTSYPAGCRILLDGASTGTTPRELSLQAGSYSVELQGEFLQPYRQKISLVPGSDYNLDARMKFRGYPTIAWLVAALASTGATVGAGIVEYHLYNDYRELPASEPQSEFDRTFDSYRTANAVRLILQNVSVVPWTGAGFCFFINRSIEKRLFFSR